MADLCRGQEPAQDRRRHSGQRRPEREADAAAARWRHRAAHRPAPGADRAGYRAVRCRPAEDAAGAGCQRAATAGRRAGRSRVAARIDRAGRADDGRSAGRAQFVDPVPSPRCRRGRISAARGQRPDRRGTGRTVPAHFADQPCRFRQHRAERIVRPRIVQLFGDAVDQLSDFPRRCGARWGRPEQGGARRRARDL